MSITAIFLFIGAILSFGVLADCIFKRYKIPDAILLLLIGLLLNFYGISIISSELTPIFSSLALMFILFEVGVELNFYTLIKEIPKASIWSISIFTLSVLITALFSVLVFGLELPLGILLGAIVGGSSSVIVAPLVSKLNIKKDTKYLLTLESAITDALCVLIAIITIEYLILSNKGVVAISSIIVSSFSVAIVVGFVLGLIWLNILPRIESYEYHYILTIGMIFFTYAITELFGGIGAISSLIFGIVLGNATRIGKIFYIKNASPMTPTTNKFHRLIVFVIRTFFFVVLGSIVRIANIEIFIYSLILTLLLFSVRCLGSRLIPDNFMEKQEKNLIAIMMSRGLAAAVLAPLPFLHYHLAKTILFPDIVFSVILVSCSISIIGLIVLKIK
ncbi:MAG: hypothetical protein DRP06_02090 [Candidatus Aenigmatarchaeota archaeon]|nr:MAG: hypothetical protein DRP06_02090 [Candidatus Aenigmarchaeota archaeon]